MKTPCSWTRTILCGCVSVLLLPALCLGEATFSDTHSQTALQSTLPRLRVEGNAIVTASGEPVVLRGIAASDPYHLAGQGHWNRQYFERAAAWGAQVVRIPVHPEFWRAAGVEAYLVLLDQAVQWASECGMYLIIDWHTIGNPITGVPHRPMYLTTQEETFYFWHRIASRYKDHSAVAFYELFNEPTSSQGRFGRLRWSDYKAFIEELIYMLYRIDDSKIPLVGGLSWGYDLSDVLEDPIAYEGIAYVTHPYPQKRKAPWIEDWERDWGHVADHYPVFATEFGFMAEGDPGAHVPTIGDETYGRALLDYMEQKGISWTVWCFDPGWPPQLIQDWEFTPTRQGAFFREAMRNAAR